MTAEEKLAMDRVTRKLWGMLPEWYRVAEIRNMSDEDAGLVLELLAS